MLSEVVLVFVVLLSTLNELDMLTFVWKVVFVPEPRNLASISKEAPIETVMVKPVPTFKP